LANNSGFSVFLDDKPHERFLEILFENRNTSYGAFFLRRTYARRMLMGTLITVCTVLFIVLLPYIVEALRRKPTFDKNLTYIPVQIEDFPTPPGQMAYLPEIQQPEQIIPQVTHDSVPIEKKQPEKQPEQKKTDADSTGKIAQNPGGGNGNDNGPPYDEHITSTAVPPGGKGGSIKQIMMDWGQYVLDHLKYPPEAKRRGLKGEVVISVVIAADGSVDKVSLMQGVSPELDSAAVKMVREMPKWTPSITNGYPQAQRLHLKVKFDPAVIK
jgi:protein TonB